RISLMHAGKVLACDAPQALIEQRGAASLEDAFIAYMEDALAEPPAPKPEAASPAPAPEPPAPTAEPGWRSWRSRIPLPLRRTLASWRTGAIQIRRDPVRLAFAFIGSALLMLVFGFGITTDVEHVRVAAFDRDHTPESRAYLDQFHGARPYFSPTPPVHDD